MSPENLDKQPLTRHTHLVRELESLRKHLLTIAGVVEDAIQKAIAALYERNPTKPEGVIAGDNVIDRWEVQLEEECLKILALYQPVAEDLRFVASVMKINNDLERMGDLAVNIAQRAAFMAKATPVPVPPLLRPMADIVVGMVKDSLDAFVEQDVERARRVCVQDATVDAHNREIIAQLIQQMRDDVSLLEPSLSLFSASRHLERIADQATNIAEDVIYLVTGEIIRHSVPEK